jgi:hypothetical protein
MIRIATASRSASDPTPFVIFPTRLRFNRELYIDLIFLLYFLLFYLRIKEKYGYGVRMQEDGALYYYGGWLQLLKEVWKIKIISWSVQSPNFLSIKNVWREMKIYIGRGRYLIRVRCLIVWALEDTWAKFGSEIFMKYAGSMPKRMRLLKQVKGGSIKY